MSISARAAASVSAPPQKAGPSCPTCKRPMGSPRSYQQHKRYFAVIKAVHFHWPENHERQFPNETSLRKWLQMKAGHFTSKAIDLYGIPEKKAQLIVQAALEAAAPYSEAVLQGRSLVIMSPKSIYYDTLGHKEFCRLNDEVDGIIKAETGLDPEAVLRETERAA